MPFVRHDHEHVGSLFLASGGIAPPEDVDEDGKCIVAVDHGSPPLAREHEVAEHREAALAYFHVADGSEEGGDETGVDEEG